LGIGAGDQHLAAGPGDAERRRQTDAAGAARDYECLIGESRHLPSLVCADALICLSADHLCTYRVSGYGIITTRPNERPRVSAYRCASAACASGNARSIATFNSPLATRATSCWIKARTGGSWIILPSMQPIRCL